MSMCAVLQQCLLWPMNHFQDNGSGHFVGVSSVASYTSAGLSLTYTASKAFVSNYHEYEIKELSTLDYPLLSPRLNPVCRHPHGRLAGDLDGTR